MIVVDASAILEVLLNTRAGETIRDRILDPQETLHAPHLIDLEIAQVLRRFWLSGEIREARGLAALEDLEDLPITLYPHHLFFSRIWALRKNVTAYDAAYLALAETLDAPLLTRDARLESVPGCRARVIVV